MRRDEAVEQHSLKSGEKGIYARRQGIMRHKHGQADFFVVVLQHFWVFTPHCHHSNHSAQLIHGNGGLGAPLAISVGLQRAIASATHAGEAEGTSYMTGFQKQAGVSEWTPRLLYQTAKSGSAGMLAGVDKGVAMGGPVGSGH